LRIHALYDNGRLVEKEEINKLATDYYKNLFGPSNISTIHMNDMNMKKLNDEDRESLTAPFSSEEIHKVVSDLKHNSAPGPDGLLAEFFQDFWDIIKNEIWNMCEDFSKGILDIERLNYGLITLIPKVDNAMEVKKFRPIYLLNVCYKIITKTLNNSLSTCINEVISENQFGFVKGKYILDCVVALHEIVHEVKRKNKMGLFSKLTLRRLTTKSNGIFYIVCSNKKALETNGEIG
jgi:hypothetical protein